MKKIVFLLIVVVLLSSCGKIRKNTSYIDTGKDKHKVEQKIVLKDKDTNKKEDIPITTWQQLLQDKKEEQIQVWFITGNIITCLWNQIEDVDMASFQLLEYNYAKDKNNLYYCGDLGFLKFDDIDLDTIQIIDSETLQDKKFKYRLGINWVLEKKEKLIQKKINLWNNFSKDLDFVYYKNQKIEGLNPKTFKKLGYRYIRDSKNVYFLDNGKYKRINNIDIDSFVILKDNDGCIWTNDYICYARDKNYIIFNTNILTWSDVKTFEILDKKLSKDKKFVYYMWSKLSNIDGVSFQVLENTKYIKDKKGIYLLDPANIDKAYIKINEIDIPTFHILENSYDNNVYAMDKSNIYYYETHKNSKWVDKNYFAIISETPTWNVKVLWDGYIEDSSSLYYFHFSTNDKKIYTYKLDIDIKSLQFINSNFLKDKNFFYIRNQNTGEYKKLDFVDRFSFHFLNSSYAMDKNKVYYYSRQDNILKVVEWVEWESFEVMDDDKECDESIDRYCLWMDDFSTYKYGVKVE